MTDRIRIVQIPVPRTPGTAPRTQPMPLRWHRALTTVFWQALAAMGSAWIPVPIDDYPQDSERSDAP
jgi:hypothetical protein